MLLQKVLKMVQTACKIFLWTCKAEMSRRALVAWDKVVLPLYAGGLNIMTLKLWNRAAISKLLWSLNQKRTEFGFVGFMAITLNRRISMTCPCQSNALGLLERL